MKSSPIYTGEPFNRVVWDLEDPDSTKTTRYWNEDKVTERDVPISRTPLKESQEDGDGAKAYEEYLRKNGGDE